MTRLFLILVPLSLAITAAADVDFNRDVKPILAQNCFACHGPDAEKREAELRLDTEEGIKAEHDGSRAVVPGDLEHSQLARRIVSQSPKKRMPPADSGKKLTAEQIATLQTWIKEGAKWSKHWAFVPPVAPALPKVTDAAWVANPIDAFVLARLEREGLKPSPRADRRTLIRRVSLDLTGLPPTPAEVDAFVADQSPRAYDALVDRLLASPAFGERWARIWLDLARYADTKGYEKDRRREMWPYRDWLINALNADMPYAQFTIEQIAGDLLPNPTPSQIIATAFNRNTMQNEEGGVDPEEFRVVAVKDRVDTTIQVWMGLTMGCAKCHSHKYDPIAQKEYYQVLAYFDQSQDANRDEPTWPVFTDEQKSANEKLNGKIAALQKTLDAATPELDRAQAAWEAGLSSTAQTRWQPLTITTATSAGGATLTPQKDASVLASGKLPGRDTYTLLAKAPAGKITGVQLEALTDKSLGEQGGPGRSAKDPNFVVNTFKVQIAPEGTEAIDVKLTDAAADFEQKDWPASGAIDDRVESGWAISPQLGKPHVAAFRAKDAPAVPAGVRLKITIDQQFGGNLVLGRFRLSVTSDAEPKLSTLPPEIAAILATPTAERVEPQRTKLSAYYRGIAPMLDSTRAEVETLRKQLATATALPVMRDLPPKRHRVTHVHNRGSFLDLGEAVEPAVPAAFGTLPDGAPANRLGLARWITDPQNPLTARVLVNRYWAQFFGTGIVETEEDFGSQGQPPSHPELLDWLATDFTRGGGSMKSLCRTIVTSATYQQSSRATPALIAKDRFNRLLARGPRNRLDAEAVRDNALAVSGLLSTKVGGPSVMPYQPEGIWASVYSGDKWVTSAGEDKHRRGVYTFIKRTSPYPSMLAMDGTSRETCTVRRITTNTPLQGLVTLNDPVYVEAAQSLARNAIAKAGTKVSDRVAFAIRQVLARTASDVELTELAALYERRLAWYADHPEDATKLATEPLGALPGDVDAKEAAAMTAVCNVILNLDETLTKQ